MGDSPECFSFHDGFALHPIHYLRAKDDFEIPLPPVDAGVICQLFEVGFIGQEFTGSPGAAACDSCRNQNYLAGAVVIEAGGDCKVFDNTTPRRLCSDLPTRDSGCCVSAIQ
jgi:hypothetical protein